MVIVTVNPTDARSLQNIADTICSSKKVVVITGAGISTNSGIPDFRSSDGLYSLVKERYPSVVVKGKDLFDSVLFSDPTTTALFYTFLAELRNSVLNIKETTPTHKFIRTLAETGRLLRCYTQNIDGLESREGLTTDLGLGKGTVSKKRKRCTLAGIPGEFNLNGNPISQEGTEKGCQVVQLHGELQSLRCMHCQGKCSYDEEKVQALMDGRAPDCPTCLSKNQQRVEAGKRGTAIGGLRPNIVLYGEEHPDADVIGTITTSDLFAKPDLMIIFGTSLKVHGLKRMVKAFAASIHSRKSDVPRVIYVNNQPASHSIWQDIIDVWVNIDCDNFVGELRKRRPGIWERQEKIEEGFQRAAGKEKKGTKLKVVKNVTTAVAGAVKEAKRASKAEGAKSHIDGSSSDKENRGDYDGTREGKRFAYKVKRKSNRKSMSASIPCLSPNKAPLTPKAKKTPLPTPPSSLSKQKSHRDVAMQSPSKTSSKISVGPKFISMQSPLFQAQQSQGPSISNTPSRLRIQSNFGVLSSDESELSEVDLSLLETPTKRRKICPTLSSASKVIDSFTTPEPPSSPQRSVLEAVVIISPRKEKYKDPRPKKSNERNKLEKGTEAGMLTEFGVLFPPSSETVFASEATSVAVAGKFEKLKKTWRLGERRSERRTTIAGTASSVL